MYNYDNWIDKLGFTLSGTTGNEETYTNVGTSAFSLGHDYFYDVEIWTGAGKTGVKLSEGVDYSLVEGSGDLANELNAKAGIITTVKEQVTIVTPAYQTGNIYITPLVSVDITEADDINLAVTKYDTASNLTTINPVLKKGEVAIESDTGFKKIGDGSTAFNDLSYEDTKSLPIGYIYTQYPNKQSPSELGLLGTWSNVSSSFSGNFFRAEGGNATAFESGTQADRFQGHWHESQYLTSVNGGTGSERTFQKGDNSLATTNTVLGNVAPSSDGVNGIPRTGIETNPINETIRIWERIA